MAFDVRLGVVALPGGWGAPDHELFKRQPKWHRHQRRKAVLWGAGELSRPTFGPAPFHVDLRLVWVRLVLEPALTRHRPRRQRRGGVALLQRAEDEDVARVHRRRLRLPLEASLSALLDGLRTVIITPHDGVPARAWRRERVG